MEQWPGIRWLRDFAPVNENEDEAKKGTFLTAAVVGRYGTRAGSTTTAMTTRPTLTSPLPHPPPPCSGGIELYGMMTFAFDLMDGLMRLTSMVTGYYGFMAGSLKMGTLGLLVGIGARNTAIDPLDITTCYLVAGNPAPSGRPSWQSQCQQSCPSWQSQCQQSCPSWQSAKRQRQRQTQRLCRRAYRCHSWSWS